MGLGQAGLGRTSLAKQYLQEAYALDINHAGVQRMLQRLEEDMELHH